MSNTTVQPSQQILARLCDPNASSDLFTWPELQKVYADRVCVSGGFLHFTLLGGSLAGVGVLQRLAGLSPGGGLVAFFILLFLLAGSIHWVRSYWFHVLPKDSAFERVHEWALANAAAESKARLASAVNRLVVPLLIVGVLAAAALTLPDKSRHEAELRQAITNTIDSADARSGGEVLGKASAWIMHAAFKDDPHASYIEFFGLEYQKFGIFSVVKNKGQIVSIGAFNQVYVRNLSSKTN